MVNPERQVWNDMSREIESIWLEGEEWGTGWDPNDVNMDVKVSFSDGSKWEATAFTYKNLQSLWKKNRNTGECMSGRYFWAENMVFVDQIIRQRVTEVVKHLIENDEFSLIFQKYSDK